MRVHGTSRHYGFWFLDQQLARLMRNMTPATGHPHLKIAVIGTSCTGKTTLCNALQGYPSVTVVPEAARQYFHDHPTPAEDRLGKDVQQLIQDRVIANERAAQRTAGGNVLLCDRSVIDPVIYTAIGGDYLGSQILYERVQQHLLSYDRLGLMDPGGIPYQADSIRIGSQQERMDVHRYFLRFLVSHRLPFDILSGTIETRIGALKQWLI
jgi:nicotinamide riboside kinase